MDEFLTVAEAAPKAKMSQQAMYSAIREGKFPCVRIGRRIRIPVSTLRQWIESGGTPVADAQDRLTGETEAMTKGCPHRPEHVSRLARHPEAGLDV